MSRLFTVLLAGALAAPIACVTAPGPAPASAPAAEAAPAPSSLDRTLIQNLLEASEERVAASLKAGASPDAKDEDGTPALMIAVRERYGEGLLGLLLARKPKVDATDAKGRTALMASVALYAPKKTALLLEAGADPNARAKDGSTALMIGADRRSAEAMELLLAAKADPDLADGRGWTTVHHALAEGSFELVGKLLEGGAKLPATGPGNLTPLLVAVSSGYGDCVRFVLDRGVDPNARGGDDGETPLASAARLGLTEPVRELLAAGADTGLRTSSGKSALELAEAGGNAEVAAMLGGKWTPRKPEGGSTVGVACPALGGKVAFNVKVEGDLAVVSVYLPKVVGAYLGQERRGAPGWSDLKLRIGGTKDGTGTEVEFGKPWGDVTIDEEKGISVKRHQVDVRASVNDETLHSSRVGCDGKEVVREMNLLRTCVSLEAMGLVPGRKVALAAKAGSCKAKGAPVVLVPAPKKGSAKKGAGGLPKAASKADEALIAAATQVRDSLVSDALAGGANPNAKDEKGNPALYIVVAIGGMDAGRIVEMLLAKGARVDAADAEGRTPLMAAAHEWTKKDLVERLLKAGANPNARAKDGATPLVFAADGDSSQGAELLLAAKADLNLADTDGWGPIHFALRKGSESMAERLLKAGATLPLKGPGPWTPLHIAAEGGNGGCVALVLDRGADPNAVGGEKKLTALMFAADLGFPGVARELLLAGADPKVADANGRTALALAEEKGNVEVAAMLGGSWTPRKPEGGTTLSFPCPKMGGSVDLNVRQDGDALVFSAFYPKVVGSYLGGFRKGTKDVSVKAVFRLDAGIALPAWEVEFWENGRSISLDVRKDGEYVGSSELGGASPELHREMNLLRTSLLTAPLAFEPGKQVNLRATAGLCGEKTARLVLK